MRLRNYYNFTFDANIFEIDLYIIVLVLHLKQNLLITKSIPESIFINGDYLIS